MQKLTFHQQVHWNIVWLPSMREWLVGFKASGHCLVRVRMLHYLRVGSRIAIMQSQTHTMQQTHMHKAVNGRVEAKKLLSCQRQSEYIQSHFKLSRVRQRFSENPSIHSPHQQYFSLSYNVIWRESMDSCKIPLGESKWILALGYEFLTLLSIKFCWNLLVLAEFV